MKHKIKESAAYNPGLEILNSVFQCFPSVNSPVQPMDCFETLDFDALLDADDLYYASLERCQEVPDVLDTLFTSYTPDLPAAETQLQDQWIPSYKATHTDIPPGPTEAIPQFDTGSPSFAVAVDLYIQREISGYDWDNITIVPDDKTCQVYNRLAEATNCPPILPTSDLQRAENVKTPNHLQMDQQSSEAKMKDDDDKMTVVIGVDQLRIPKMSPGTLSQVFSAQVRLDAEAVSAASSVAIKTEPPWTPPTRSKRKYRRTSGGRKSNKSTSKKSKGSDRSLPLAVTPTSSLGSTLQNDENAPPKKRRGRKPKSANTSLMNMSISTSPAATATVSPPATVLASGSPTSDSVTTEFTSRTTRAMRRQNRLCKSIG